MTKQQVIDILEAYKPSSNIYYLIDEIIGSVKQEPDNEWMKCSEEMPEPMRQVLFYDECFKEYAAGYYNKNYNAIQVGCALLGTNDEYERFTHWMLLPKPPEVEQ